MSCNKVKMSSDFEFYLILIKYYCYANFVKQCIQFIPVFFIKYDTDRPLCKNFEVLEFVFWA